MHIPNQDAGKNRRRHAMPQIADFDAFLKDLDDNFITYTTMKIDPEELTPTQGNFNEEKVARLVADFDKIKNKPIVSSDDDFVLDGHHRWLAAAQKKKPIASRVIGLGIDDLLDFVKGKPYIETRGLNESVSFTKIIEYRKGLTGVVYSTP